MTPDKIEQYLEKLEKLAPELATEYINYCLLSQSAGVIFGLVLLISGLIVGYRSRKVFDFDDDDPNFIKYFIGSIYSPTATLIGSIYFVVSLCTLIYTIMFPRLVILDYISRLVS